MEFAAQLLFAMWYLIVRYWGIGVLLVLMLFTGYTLGIVVIR